MYVDDTFEAFEPGKGLPSPVLEEQSGDITSPSIQDGEEDEEVDADVLDEEEDLKLTAPSFTFASLSKKKGFQSSPDTVTETSGNPSPAP